MATTKINQKLLDRYKKQIEFIQEKGKHETLLNQQDRKDRKENSLLDFQVFVKTYFSHRCEDRNGIFCNLAWFHRSAVDAILNNKQSLYCFEWSRGHGKSTVLSLFLPVYMMLIGKTKNLLLVSIRLP